jgi:beclin
LNFRLVGYRLRPMGSMSKIDKFDLDPRTGQIMKTVSLELYSSGDYSFERILTHKRLDYAMVAFLTVLKQVGEFVESSDASLKLPYVIEKDKIGGCSIRLSMSASNDSWTTACKYVLTNCKWILAYASIH